jgi:hypothetical protein
LLSSRRPSAPHGVDGGDLCVFSLHAFFVPLHDSSGSRP